VSRKIFVLVASMALSLAFLAACETDDAADDTNGVTDDPIGAADDEDTGPIEDDAALDDEIEDDQVANGEDDDAVVEELDDDDATTDDAATQDDDADMNGTDDGAVVEELDDDDAATEDDEDTVTTEHPADMDDEDTPVDGDVIAVTLSDHEIEMDSSIESGAVTLEVTNEGDSMHGIAIQEAQFADEDDNGDAGAFIASTTVRPGDTSTISVELESGEYIVFCPVGEHREEHDMEMELTVE
jgi:hypothetical protein